MPFDFSLADYLKADQIKYAWKNNGVVISDDAKTLLRNQGWDLIETTPQNKSFTTSTGTFSLALLTFKFKRIP